MGLLSSAADGVGTLVYIACYGPVWIVWNFVGKWVVKAFIVIRKESDAHDADLIMERFGSLSKMKQMLLTAYYNAVRQELALAGG